MWIYTKWSQMNNANFLLYIYIFFLPFNNMTLTYTLNLYLIYKLQTRLETDITSLPFTLWFRQVLKSFC